MGSGTASEAAIWMDVSIVPRIRPRHFTKGGFPLAKMHGIRRKILINTAMVLLPLAMVLMAVMVLFLQSLTGTILLDTMLPMA